MRRLLEPLRRLWRDRVAGPKLRTYEDAREELGGVPWRAFNSTERWFIPSGGSTVAEAKPLTLDTSALLLTRPTLLERVKGKEKWLAGGRSRRRCRRRGRSCPRCAPADDTAGGRRR